MSATTVGFTSVSKSVQIDASAKEHSPDVDSLAAGSIVASSSATDLMNSVDISVECIDEERLGLGIGDYADVTFLDNDSSGEHALPGGPYEVIRVDNSKRAVLRFRTLTDKWSEMVDQFLTKIKAGKATIKKVRSSDVVRRNNDQQ